MCCLMEKPCNPISIANLREFTGLSAQVSNATRYSSTATMLRRFLCAKDHLEKLNIRDIGSEISILSVVRYLEQLCAKFTELDCAKKELDSHNLNLTDAQVLFDTVLEDYPEKKDQLGVSPSIVHVSISVYCAKYQKY